MTVRGGTDGKHTEHELWSPYVIGSNPQLGGNIIYEPLAFYSAFADKEILWLAESYGYNDDYTELTVKTRSGIAWSDGKPFSAEDVAYSLNTLNELGAKVKWGKDVQEVLDQATVVDPNTTLIRFKVPAPRFFYHMLSYKYDIGLHIVPKHIFEGQDWTTFAAYDLAKGWPVTTGPWKVVNVSPTQKVFDRRDSWWGVEAGVGKLPEVERIVLLPDAGEQQLAQGLISNAVDFSTGLQVATFPTVFAGNPNITTFTGKELPWGNVDWWPTSLYLNCERAPFDDPKFRWAISYLIDRQVLIDVGWGGSSSLSPLPMPDGSVYKGLEPYFESAAPLLEKYPTNAFDPDKGAELMEELGWKKGGDGLYQDPTASRSRSRSSASSISRRSDRCWSSCCAARASTPPTGSRRTCSTASSPATSMPRSSATAAVSAIPTRRCASTSRPHRRCPADRRSTWSTSPAGTTRSTT